LNSLHDFCPPTLGRAARLAEAGPLDVSDLWWSQVFVARPRQPRVLYLRRVWLE
jgi:hypothetical protein